MVVFILLKVYNGKSKVKTDRMLLRHVQFKVY